MIPGCSAKTMTRITAHQPRCRTIESDDHQRCDPVRFKQRWRGTFTSRDQRTNPRFHTSFCTLTCAGSSYQRAMKHWIRFWQNTLITSSRKGRLSLELDGCSPALNGPTRGEEGGWQFRNNGTTTGAVNMYHNEPHRSLGLCFRPLHMFVSIFAGHDWGFSFFLASFSFY